MTTGKAKVEVGPVAFDTPQDGTVLQSIGSESVFRIAGFCGEQELGHGSSFILNHEITSDGIKLWCLTNLHVARGVLNLHQFFRMALSNGAPEQFIKEIPAGLRVHVGETTIPIDSFIVPKGEFFKPDHAQHLDFAIFSFTVPLDRQTRYFPINKNSPISAGSKAYALGYPFIMNLSIADGLISRVYEDGDGDAERKAGADIKFWKWGIQHNIAINGGNSGGPTISESGVVIGISTFGYLEKDGLNFSINVSSIFECISDKSNLEEISIQPLVKKLALRAIESAGYG
jgi:hypothetical protein